MTVVTVPAMTEMFLIVLTSSSVCVAGQARETQMRDTTHHDYTSLREALGRPDMAPKNSPEQGVKVRQLTVFHPQDRDAGLGHVRGDERGEGLICQCNADWQGGGA